MNREVQENGEGGEGKLKKLLLLKHGLFLSLKSASNLNGNLNCSKELEHYAS